MVPLEPGTKSKELEIAACSESSTVASRSAASEAADLTIRILRQDATSGTAALTWQSESVLVYMIADLVAASHGRTAINMRDALAAHFDNPLQALVAAKRIILEFLACRPDDATGAAILVHPAAEFPQKMAQSALQLAEPGQILVSPEVSMCLEDLRGIELRRVAAVTTGGMEHAGLSELIGLPSWVCGTRVWEIWVCRTWVCRTWVWEIRVWAAWRRSKRRLEPRMRLYRWRPR